ncbi:MAG: hypothetical protein J0I77_18015 [Rudaea sp.]|uniref:hypothetical protein n=1 Tax=unclassified Rudaea TaxID=2627037 RepID=UPI0010F90816|nr:MULTISPECIES: hypothetical protein [unclassified Rudaea]MBN8887626.1 hypothetical protein [Rudaea sp.]
MEKIRQALLVFVLLCAASTASAQVVVPAGGSLALGGGSLNLSGSSLQISGLLSLAGGSLANVANLIIGAGGTLDAGSGQITVKGDWSNSGNFLAGSSSVNFVDGVASSQILGNTGFANVSFLSATGKSYLFAAGTTQTIAGLLTIGGVAGLPIQFRSTAAGQAANINLLSGGSQSITHVGVSDVHAVGQQLAPNQTNEGGSGNATGWFAAVINNTAIPANALSPLGMLLFGLAMLAGAGLARRPGLKA